MPSRVVAFTEVYDPKGERLLALRAMYRSLMDQTFPVKKLIVMGSGGAEKDTDRWPRVRYFECSNSLLAGRDKRR